MVLIGSSQGHLFHVRISLYSPKTRKMNFQRTQVRFSEKTRAGLFTRPPRYATVHPGDEDVVSDLTPVPVLRADEEDESCLDYVQ